MEASILNLASAVQRRLEAQLDADLAREGLSRGEWRLLRASHEAGATAPSVLADMLGLTRGGVTRLIDRLRARRLIVRAAAGRDDRRYRTIALTGAGALLVERLAVAERDGERAVLSPLADRDRERLVELLTRIVTEP